MENNLQHIVYKTTNLLNGMIYIGKFKIRPKGPKNYLGSGSYLKSAIVKYGKENFVRETLFTFDTAEEAFTKESELVTLEFVNRKDTYNLCVGGKSGAGELIPSEETRYKMSKSNQHKKGKDSHLYGTHPSEATRKLLSEGQLGAKNHNYGTKASPETRKLMSEAKTGVKHNNYGKPVSFETRIKISKALLGEEKYYQRLKDTEEIEKVRGWKAKLARKWGVTHSMVASFIKHSFNTKPM